MPNPTEFEKACDAVISECERQGENQLASILRERMVEFKRRDEVLADEESRDGVAAEE